MAVTKPIHEIKDHLSSVIAELIETGEEDAVRHRRDLVTPGHCHAVGWAMKNSYE